MLSINKCKKILGQVTEEEAEQIRNDLYSLTEIFVNEFLKEIGKNKKSDIKKYFNKKI